ncbi:MAG: metallophosphoesterase [Tissierellia bacterium]|nr:metallophosphoesterase [Tissierellia bacterium]
MIVIIILISIIYLYYQSAIPKLNRIEIKLNGEGLNLLQISDFHSNKKALKHSKELLLNAKRLELDIIVFTGDLISRTDRDFTTVEKLLSDLKNLNIPMVFVSGNHEIENLAYKKFMKLLSNYSVKILDDCMIKIKDYNLIGLSPKNRFHRLNEIEFDRDSKNIILSHIPTNVDLNNLEGESIILAGHTHGGQIRLPIIGQIFTPEQPLFGGYDKGLTNLTKSIKLYIDSGLGNSKLPIRICNRIQYTFIKIDG